MLAPLLNQTRNLLFLPANGVLLDTHRTSWSFSTGNSSNISLSHREKFSLFFTEVIRSLFLSSFQRDKGMVSARESYHLKRQRRVGRGLLRTLLSLVESRVFFSIIYIWVPGYFRSCKKFWESLLHKL